MVRGIVTRRTAMTTSINPTRRALTSCRVLVVLFKPIIQKTIPPASKIARQLITKSRKAPPASLNCPLINDNPTTQSGGTNDIAIATPGSELEISRRLRQKAPAAPEASATSKDVSPGDVRERI